MQMRREKAANARRVLRFAVHVMLLYLWYKRRHAATATIKNVLVARSLIGMAPPHGLPGAPSSTPISSEHKALCSSHLPLWRWHLLICRAGGPVAFGAEFSSSCSGGGWRGGCWSQRLPLSCDVVCTSIGLGSDQWRARDTPPK